MACLGLDWGNVPSWLSATGVGIAAAVGVAEELSVSVAASTESLDFEQEMRSAAHTSAVFSRTLPPKSTTELYSVVHRLESPRWMSRRERPVPSDRAAAMPASGRCASHNN